MFGETEHGVDARLLESVCGRLRAASPGPATKTATPAAAASGSAGRGRRCRCSGITAARSLHTNSGAGTTTTTTTAATAARTCAGKFTAAGTGEDQFDLLREVAIGRVVRADDTVAIQAVDRRWC